MSRELYQQIIGSLLFLIPRTRRDILAAVLILTRFQISSTSYCHRDAKRILRYLEGTSNLGIKMESGKLNTVAFVDANYAGDKVDRKSRSGYIIKLGDETCIWEQ